MRSFDIPTTDAAHDRPYYGTGTPDVIWSQGTIEASVAFDRVNIDETQAADSLARLLIRASNRDLLIAN